MFDSYKNVLVFLGHPVLLADCLSKLCASGDSVSWDLDQNVPRQSHSRILKLAITQEGINELP